MRAICDWPEAGVTGDSDREAGRVHTFSETTEGIEYGENEKVTVAGKVPIPRQ